uniref:Ribonuclease H-like domain-containing protein n=1 Tax=Tanacetum cinerariifolium TaxID=118510 RepID=A0A6L2K870_TANCI|nr:ribonuclease H-like domain-containing protein [Tanacetum cinerariifolium]
MAYEVVAWTQREVSTITNIAVTNEDVGSSKGMIPHRPSIGLVDGYNFSVSPPLTRKLFEIENLVDHKVKVIRCDNENGFKNSKMNQFCEIKGKFDGKADEGVFVGYSLNSKSFTIFNSRTRIVEENLHIKFSESTPNVLGSRPDWLFDIDALTRTMSYELIVIDNELPFDPNMPALEDVGTFDFSNEDEDDDEVVDINNLDTIIQVIPTLTTRIHKDHPLDQVIGDLHSATQIRNMTKNLVEHSSGLLPWPKLSMGNLKFMPGLVRAATIASSLEVEQDIGNINKTQSKATPNKASSLGTTLGDGPRCQDPMRDTITQTRFENVFKFSNDSLLVRAKVDFSKDDQSLGEDASKQRRKIHDIDADEDITLVNDQDDAKTFDINDLHGKEVFDEEVADKVVNDEAQKVVKEVVKDNNTAKLIVDAA